MLEAVLEGAERGWQAVEWARRWARHGLVRWSGTRARRWWAVVGVAGEAGEAHRGRMLGSDRDAAGGGVFDGSLVLVGKAVVL